ncbi:MAG: hypothetical protein CMH16_28425 [Methylobacterium sp.]|nr:hypothetical protein [Methylobacterium sp.]
MTLRILSAGDRLTLEPIVVATLLKRRIVEQALLHPGRAQHLAIGQDHRATLRNEARSHRAVEYVINPK